MTIPSLGKEVRSALCKGEFPTSIFLGRGRAWDEKWEEGKKTWQKENGSAPSSRASFSWMPRLYIQICWQSFLGVRSDGLHRKWPSKAASRLAISSSQFYRTLRVLCLKFNFYLLWVITVDEEWSGKWESRVSKEPPECWQQWSVRSSAYTGTLRKDSWRERWPHPSSEDGILSGSRELRGGGVSF